jgi:hypothetical protein
VDYGYALERVLGPYGRCDFHHCPQG